MVIMIGIIFLIVGVWQFQDPEDGWYMDEGWKFKNVEPSETSIVLTKFKGIACIILGIGLVMIGILTFVSEVTQTSSHEKKIADNISDFKVQVQLENIDEIMLSNMWLMGYPYSLNENEIKQFLELIHQKEPIIIEDDILSLASNDPMGACIRLKNGETVEMIYAGSGGDGFYYEWDELKHFIENNELKSWMEKQIEKKAKALR